MEHKVASLSLFALVQSVEEVFIVSLNMASDLFPRFILHYTEQVHFFTKHLTGELLPVLNYGLINDPQDYSRWQNGFEKKTSQFSLINRYRASSFLYAL